MQENNTNPINPTEPTNNGKGFSVAALVLGIVAIVLAWFYMVNIAALVCGIVGIILAVKGKKLAKAAGAPTGIATAGLVLSIIGTIIAGIGFLACTICVACFGNAINQGLSELSGVDWGELVQ